MQAQYVRSTLTVDPRRGPREPGISEASFYDTFSDVSTKRGASEDQSQYSHSASDFLVAVFRSLALPRGFLHNLFFFFLFYLPALSGP